MSDPGDRKVKNTTYPQTNGIVERMHSFLESLLTKVHQRRLDWAQQLPFDLFTLQQALHRDSGLSPFKLVCGYNVRIPLEVLYKGWVDEKCDNLTVSICEQQLNDERLELIRDMAKQRIEKKYIGETKKRYDKKTCV